jgi:hypothetical protein
MQSTLSEQFKQSEQSDKLMHSFGTSSSGFHGDERLFCLLCPNSIRRVWPGDVFSWWSEAPDLTGSRSNRVLGKTSPRLDVIRQTLLSASDSPQTRYTCAPRVLPFGSKLAIRLRHDE